MRQLSNDLELSNIHLKISIKAFDTIIQWGITVTFVFWLGFLYVQPLYGEYIPLFTWEAHITDDAFFFRHLLESGKNKQSNDKWFKSFQQIEYNEISHKHDNLNIMLWF